MGADAEGRGAEGAAGGEAVKPSLTEDERICVRCTWWKRNGPLLEGDDPMATTYKCTFTSERFQVEGRCFRFPKWETVWAAHFCGEFVERTREAA